MHTVSIGRLEKIGGSRRKCVARDLTQWRDVVHYPDSASLGRRNQVTLMHQQIGDPRRGQILLQRLPAIAIVERHEDALVGPGVKQMP